MTSKTTYDPRAHGARCDECPLRGSTVVPPEHGASNLEILSGHAVAIVGEAPGEDEERQERPFIGKSGAELDKALKIAGIARGRVHVTNVLACRPPGNRLADLLAKISRDNKKVEKAYHAKVTAADKAGDPPPPKPRLTLSPIECCAPRFEAEIINFTNFITLGKTATQAITGGTASILAVRGGLTTLEASERTPTRRVMPTIHPAFCLRQPRWFHVFRNDIHKAARWFRGEAEWVPPKITRNPDALTLQNFLSRTDVIYSFDLETDGIESLTAKIRCIAIGDGNEVMVVGFLGKDGHTRFYSDLEELPIRTVLHTFFEDEDRVKYGWNSLNYDATVLRFQWGVEVKNHIDGILIHKGVESELPHNLAYAVSMGAEAPAWKTDRAGNRLSTEAETDEALHNYCSLDAHLTAKILPGLSEQLRLRNQVHVWQFDQRVQLVCRSMHATGMFVDQAARLAKEKELLSRRFTLLADIRDRLQLPDFNPGSVFQVRDILFEQWKLTPPLDDEDRYTASQDPSTADLVLRALLTDHSVPDEQREVIKLLRYYRKIQKVLGTYVVKLRPANMAADLGWDEEDDWADKETRERYGEVKQGIVDPRTGRMYPGWSAVPPVTGRLSSSKPINAMNFPSKLRGMACAAPGNVLVGADSDQIEVRVAASLWEVELYLRAFEEGKDVHSMNSFTIFGDAFCKAAGIDPAAFSAPGMLVGTAWDAEGKFIGKGDAKNLRSLGKAVFLASQYMAGVEKAQQMIQRTEVPAKDPTTGEELKDGTTDLPYALLPLRKVREMRDRWMGGVPEYEHGWKKEINEWRLQGYLTDPILGRRRDFLDGENPNELVNYKVQSSAASIISTAMLEIYDQIPEGKWGPGTGIVNQCHDHIVVECPENEAEGVAKIIERAMNVSYAALPGVKFTASASIGHSWDKV
jgi:DNA polymerase I-like protein with 3'-5' exonuclease and polymerase domains/uracil-DNA glycosylase